MDSRNCPKAPSWYERTIRISHVSFCVTDDFASTRLTRLLQHVCLRWIGFEVIPPTTVTKGKSCRQEAALQAALLTAWKTQCYQQRARAPSSCVYHRTAVESSSALCCAWRSSMALKASGWNKIILTKSKLTSAPADTAADECKSSCVFKRC